MQDELTPDIRRFFRDQLREARSVLLKDGEAYETAVQVLERIGRYIRKRSGNGLGAYRTELETLARESALSELIPSKHRHAHLPFGVLFDVLKDGRNSAVHEGALARHLSVNALTICIILEDALMSEQLTIADFMVRDPVVALMWQPLSMIRQVMLSNAFSYLPVRTSTEGDWGLVSDCSLAQFFRSAQSKGSEIGACLCPWMRRWQQSICTWQRQNALLQTRGWRKWSDT